MTDYCLNDQSSPEKIILKWNILEWRREEWKNKSTKPKTLSEKMDILSRKRIYISNVYIFLLLPSFLYGCFVHLYIYTYIYVYKYGNIIITKDS